MFSIRVSLQPAAVISLSNPVPVTTNRRKTTMELVIMRQLRRKSGKLLGKLPMIRMIRSWRQEKKLMKQQMMIPPELYINALYGAVVGGAMDNETSDRADQLVAQVVSVCNDEFLLSAPKALKSPARLN
jgi:hypothetical protein